jgi:hypothetical protein
MMISIQSQRDRDERVLAQIARSNGDGGVFSPELRVVKAFSPEIKVQANRPKQNFNNLQYPQPQNS